MKYFAGKKSRRIARVTPHNYLFCSKRLAFLCMWCTYSFLKHVDHLGSLLVTSPCATTPSTAIMATFPELIFFKDGDLFKIKQKLGCLSTKTGNSHWKVKLLNDVGVASLNQKTL